MKYRAAIRFVEREKALVAIVRYPSLRKEGFAALHT
jgi:hypothetical protein